MYLICCERVSEDIEFGIRISVVIREQVSRVTTLARVAMWGTMFGATTCWVIGPYSTTHDIYVLDVSL